MCQSVPKEVHQSVSQSLSQAISKPANSQQLSLEDSQPVIIASQKISQSVC